LYLSVDQCAVPFWYLGTKYKFEFYIRFKNVPTPYEVVPAADTGRVVEQVSRQYRHQCAAILARFMIATASACAGLAIGKYERVRDFFMPVSRSCGPFRRSPGCRCRSCCGRTTKCHRLHYSLLCILSILLNSIMAFIRWTACCCGLRAARRQRGSLFLNVILRALAAHLTGLAVGMAWPGSR